jgi:hypothetical protein
MVDSSPCGLMQSLAPDTTVPSLHHHYSDFVTTTDRSVPVPGISTRLLAGSPLEALPWHPNDRFSSSVTTPVAESRRLYAGCRSVGNQESSELVPSHSQKRVLTSTESFSTPRQRFTRVRLYYNSPYVSGTPFPRTLPPAALYRDCYEVVCDQSLKTERGGPSSIVMTTRLLRVFLTHWLLPIIRYPLARRIPPATHPPVTEPSAYIADTVEEPRRQPFYSDISRPSYPARSRVDC